MAQYEVQWHLRLSAEWETLDYEFPGPVAKLPTDAAIYRWCVGGEPKYVGQARNLRQRINGYVNPGPTQQTNQQLNKRLHLAREHGQTLRLERLSQLWLDDNGVLCGERSLDSAALRSLLEGWAVWRLTQDGYELWNKATGKD